MADKEISALTAATKPDGTEVIHGKQGANSRKITSQQLVELGASIVTDSTTSRAFVVGDVGKYIRFTNGAAITATFNTGIFSANDEMIFEQAGAGVITFTAGAGFTLTSAGSLVDSNGQQTVQGIKFLSASSAILFGNLA